MVTLDEVKNVHFLSNRLDKNCSIFTNNTVITSFNSFHLFTNLVYLNGTFSGCTSLESVTLPSLKTYQGSEFTACPNMKNIIVPEGVEEIGPMFLSDSDNAFVDFPSTLKLLGRETGVNSIFWKCANMTLIVRATLPPALYSWGYGVTFTGIYVPDGSVDYYKTASVWSVKSANIMPLSEYAG